MVRDPNRANLRFTSDPELAQRAQQLLEVVQGDVTDPKSLHAALEQCSGIIFAATSSGWTQLKSPWRTARTTSPREVDCLVCCKPAVAGCEGARVGVMVLGFGGLVREGGEGGCAKLAERWAMQPNWARCRIGPVKALLQLGNESWDNLNAASTQESRKEKQGHALGGNLLSDRAAGLLPSITCLSCPGSLRFARL